MFLDRFKSIAVLIQIPSTGGVMVQSHHKSTLYTSVLGRLSIFNWVIFNLLSDEIWISEGPMIRYPESAAHHIFIFGLCKISKDRPNKFDICPMLDRWAIPTWDL